MRETESTEKGIFDRITDPDELLQSGYKNLPLTKTKRLSTIHKPRTFRTKSFGSIITNIRNIDVIYRHLHKRYKFGLIPKDEKGKVKINEKTGEPFTDKDISSQAKFGAIVFAGLDMLFGIPLGIILNIASEIDKLLVELKLNIKERSIRRLINLVRIITYPIKHLARHFIYYGLGSKSTKFFINSDINIGEEEIKNSRPYRVFGVMLIEFIPMVIFTATLFAILIVPTSLFFVCYVLPKKAYDVLTNKNKIEITELKADSFIKLIEKLNKEHKGAYSSATWTPNKKVFLAKRGGNYTNINMDAIVITIPKNFDEFFDDPQTNNMMNIILRYQQPIIIEEIKRKDGRDNSTGITQQCLKPDSLFGDKIPNRRLMDQIINSRSIVRNMLFYAKDKNAPDDVAKLAHESGKVMNEIITEYKKKYQPNEDLVDAENITRKICKTSYEEVKKWGAEGYKYYNNDSPIDQNSTLLKPANRSVFDRIKDPETLRNAGYKELSVSDKEQYLNINNDKTISSLITNIRNFDVILKDVNNEYKEDKIYFWGEVDTTFGNIPIKTFLDIIIGAPIGIGLNILTSIDIKLASLIHTLKLPEPFNYLRIFTLPLRYIAFVINDIIGIRTKSTKFFTNKDEAEYFYDKGLSFFPDTGREFSLIIESKSSVFITYDGIVSLLIFKPCLSLISYILLPVLNIISIPFRILNFIIVRPLLNAMGLSKHEIQFDQTTCVSGKDLNVDPSNENTSTNTNENTEENTSTNTNNNTDENTSTNTNENTEENTSTNTNNNTDENTSTNTNENIEENTSTNTNNNTDEKNINDNTKENESTDANENLGTKTPSN